ELFFLAVAGDEEFLRGDVEPEGDAFLLGSVVSLSGDGRDAVFRQVDVAHRGGGVIVDPGAEENADVIGKIPGRSDVAGLDDVGDLRGTGGGRDIGSGCRYGGERRI